jgi:hypothetical protein
MKNQRETIRRMVGYLNNEEKDGGFWLPNIQRPLFGKRSKQSVSLIQYLESIP